MAKRKIIKFRAVKTVKMPVIVKFKTKNGETVSFKAIKTVKKPVVVKFKVKKTRRK